MNSFGQVSLPTPTGLTATIDANNRFTMKWNCDISSAFTPLNTTEYAWFEIEIDNGSGQLTTSKTFDYFIANPLGQYEYKSPFYLKPDAQYYFRIRAHYKANTATDQNVISSGWSNISGSVVSATAPEYGITVLTHGFQLLGEVADISDFENHAKRIYNRLGGEATILTNDGVTGLWKIYKDENGKVYGNGDRTKELIFLYNWSSSSNGAGTFGEFGELEGAADRLFSMLTEVKVKTESNVQSNSVQIWYQDAQMITTKKSHFIGHSRGVGMMLQVFHRFGKYYPTVKISHFTSLDGHPAAKYGDTDYNTNSLPSGVNDDSPKGSLPGVYNFKPNNSNVIDLPKDCYADFSWKNMASAAVSAGSGSIIGVLGALQPFFENKLINPLCKSSGDAYLSLKIPENVERADNYYRQDGLYEEMYWVDENLLKIVKIIKDIKAIYGITGIDPNPGTWKTGFQSGHMNSIKTSFLRDLNTLKVLKIKAESDISVLNVNSQEIARLKGIWGKLTSIYGSADGVYAILTSDLNSVFENIANMEIDKAFKIAQFDGVPIHALGSWSKRLENNVVSSGFASSKTPFGAKINSALGSMLGGAHSGVHHWYFGTVDPISSSTPSTWYGESNGFAADKNQTNLGFYYSRLGKHLSEINANFDKITIAEMDEQLKVRQETKELNPIFNGDFRYGEVMWFANGNLHITKDINKFPIHVSKIEWEIPQFIGISAKAAYLKPRVNLRHQMFYLPKNQIGLKFTISGPQSASFGISASFEYQGALGNIESVKVANDIITHNGGTSHTHHFLIPENLKGRMVWLTLNFEYRTSQNLDLLSVDKMIYVYMDDVEVSNNLNDSAPLGINTTENYCSEAHYYQKTDFVLNSTWANSACILSGSEGFVNWWNLPDFKVKEDNSYFKSHKNETVTWGEAAEAIYLAAKKLGLLVNSQICGSEKDQRAKITKYLFDNSIISRNTPYDKILISDLYSMIFKLILDKGTLYPYSNRPRDSKTIYTGNEGDQNIIKAIKTAGALIIDNNPNIFWLSDGFDGGKISGTEEVSRTVLSKTATLAYYFKKYTLTNTNARIGGVETVNQITDFTSLGSKFEILDSENDLTPTSVVDGKTEFYKSGQVINFSFPTDTLSDGTKVNFYWSTNGVAKGGSLVPITTNYQSVKYTAPTVTAEETFQLYIYLGGDNGKSAEMYKEIVVRPDIGQNNNVLKKSEYFIDSDPGVGLATPINNNISRFGIDSTFYIDTDILTVGSHTLNIRVNDLNGNWSAVKTSTFEVTNPCVNPQTATIYGSISTSPGQDVDLILNFTGKAPFSFTLSNGTTGVSTELEKVIRVNPTISTNYTITTASNECGQLIKDGLAQVNVYDCDLPSALITGSTSIFSGETINLNLSFVGTPPFQFTLNNGTSGTATTNSITLPVSPQTDTYYYLTNVNNACGAGLLNGIVEVKIKPCILPTATILNNTIEINDYYSAGDKIIRVDFTGTKPINYQFSDEVISRTTSSDIFNIQKSFFFKQNFRVKSVSNRCGNGTTHGLRVINYNDCPQNINNPNGVVALANGTNFRKGHYASEKITSSNNISDLTNLISGKSIELKPGFSAGINETFKAEIRTCLSPTTDGLVANYRFHTLNDYSGNYNNGQGNVSYTNNRFGNSFGAIDQSNFTINSSQSLNLTDEITVSSWIRPKTTHGLNSTNLSLTANGTQYLLSRISNCNSGLFSGFAIGYQQINNGINIILNNNGTIQQIIIPNKTIVSKWTHLVVRLKKTNSNQMYFEVFLDGNKYSASAFSNSLDFSLTNSNNIIFGALGCGLNQNSQANFDDLRIYNRALTDSEVQTLYNAEKP